MTMEELEPGLTRLLAPNPSPLTAEGTNTYILGSGRCVVIDPGPLLTEHLEHIMSCLGDKPVEAILVTHSHRDHSPLARPLAARTGAPVYAFGPTGAGRSAIMEELAAASDLGGGEGADPDFAPDIMLADGETLTTDAGEITALHSPGHFGNHLCFAWRDVLFSGDHVMGWASTLVSPPDGDLTDFMASAQRLTERKDRVYYPGHGAPITDPQARVDWLIAHRLEREAQVLQALKDGPRTAQELTERIYTDVPASLWPAAARNVLAHLIDLTGRKRVMPQGPLTQGVKFTLL